MNIGPVTAADRRSVVSGVLEMDARRRPSSEEGRMVIAKNVMRGLILWTGVGCGLAAVSRTSADEPAQEFVDQLRSAGYFDVAIDYLESLRTSNITPPGFKARIPFEQAATLIQANSATKDIDRIEANLDRADQLLREFSDSKPRAELLSEAERTRAEVLFGRGRLATVRAKSDRATADQAQQLMNTARDSRCSNQPRTITGLDQKLPH